MTLLVQTGRSTTTLVQRVDDEHDVSRRVFESKEWRVKKLVDLHRHVFVLDIRVASDLINESATELNRLTRQKLG